MSRQEDSTTNHNRAATLSDVARLVGVHEATVSRALSQPERVKRSTLDRIRAAIDELGYVPNRGARQLAGGRTGMLAMLVPDITNPFFGAITQSVQRHAADHGSYVVVADTNRSPATEADQVRTFAPNVDGLIICSPVSTTGSLRHVAGQTPLVLANRAARAVPSVAIDQGEIVRLGVEHLRSLGHRRIGVAFGPKTYWSSIQRRRSVPADVTEIDTPAATYDDGASTASEVIDRGLTGVVAFNDVAALGLIHELFARGLQVPDDISVVGSDDVPVASMSRPALTTVAGNPEWIGSNAYDLVTGPTDSAPSLFEQPHLVERASTSPPKKDR